MSLTSAALDPNRRTHLRLVRADAADAAYICRLRSDEVLGAHLSASTNDVAAQLAWLQGYKAREAAGSEYYFVIVSDGEDRGVVRMYDFREVDGRRSFCWGSWIVPPPRAPGLVTYSALLVYEVGFDALGFEQSHFDVRLANTGVIGFHERAGARRVAEDHQDAFFRFLPVDHDRLKAASAAQIA
ncbi:MAG: GNAT family N-acetyltransferase, partial [Proteobacteria bacterium]|nr:GNAT family N-acetyltransferase [Pseudomonadota bacterium]